MYESKVVFIGATETFLLLEICMHITERFSIKTHVPSYRPLHQPLHVRLEGCCVITVVDLTRLYRI